MMTYNLLKEEKEILEMALKALIVTYDQWDIKDLGVVTRLRRKITESTKVTLTTEVKNKATHGTDNNK